MTKITELSLVDVIHRTAARDPTDLEPLAKYLGYELPGADLTSRKTAEALAGYLRRMGGNDFANALRWGEGVDYEEVVCDVASKLKATGVDLSKPVAENEAKIIEKLFADTLESMSEDERRILFKSMNLDVKEIPIASSAAVLMPIVLRQFGGFATYRLAVVLANVVSRALLGSGLSIAANAALTRTIGTLLGPVGWIATGAWLAVDLAGPAFRKTVPAVLYVGMLRQVLMNRITIGVVGDGSTGKDTLIERVFDIPMNVDPVAGSTTQSERHAVGGNNTVEVINYPGFNDYRPNVNADLDQALHHTDVFLMLVDATRGISGTDIEILRKVRGHGRPVLICLNKCDAVRTEADGLKLIDAAKARFGISRVAGEQTRAADADMVLCALNPLPAVPMQPKGRRDILEWSLARLADAGKSDLALRQLVA